MEEILQTKINPIESAEEAGLRYVEDNVPGFTRTKSGKIFQYLDTKNKKITDEKIIERINHLRIPPAYKNIWISPYKNGHLQATGIDEKGRKQYIYHEKWREVRDETKYHRMIEFGYKLSVIREKVEQHLRLPGLAKEKVLATIVKLMEETNIRVGNEQYAKENKSYGLTTLHNKHVAFEGSKIKFEFKGKSGVSHAITLEDKRLIKIIKRCYEIPGFELFQYIDEQGNKYAVHSHDVNEYIKEMAGADFTAKDFRTWHGTVLAAKNLIQLGDSSTKKDIKKNLNNVIKQVAENLGNTVAVCRKCYIHPMIINSYLDGSLKNKLQGKIKTSKDLKNLEDYEKIVVAFLEKNK